MAKRVSDDLNILPQPLDREASREERRATGRMVALMVAFIIILSILYQAWIRKIPVLAGVTIPALIMLLYAGWVLFLAKKDKRRMINAENNLRANRASSIALSEIACTAPQPSNSTSSDLFENGKEVSPKKGKSKKSKTKMENQIIEYHHNKKQSSFGNSLPPHIAVNEDESDNKLSRSFSTYN